MRDVNTIKITAFFLFFSSLCGILLALFAYNHLISYSVVQLFPDGKRGTYSFECNIDNFFCADYYSSIKHSKLTECDEKVYSTKRYKDKNLVPTLCDAPNLDPFGSCRVCSVEVALEENGKVKEGKLEGR